MLNNFPTQKDSTWFRQVGTSVIECHYAAGCPAQPFGEMNTLSIPTGTFHAVPFMSGHGGVIDKLSFEVTTVGGANSKARSGIYTNKANTFEVYPDILVVDGGEFDTSAVGGAGVKAATPGSATYLAPNTLYWFVILSGTAAPTVRSIADGAAWSLLGYPSTIGTANRTHIQVAQAYGALPSSFPGSGTIASARIPLITVSFSSL